MSDRIYRMTEVVGTAQEGTDQAIRNALDAAAQTVRHIDWFEVTQIRGHVDDDAIEHFQVTLKIGFRLDPKVNGD